MTYQVVNATRAGEYSPEKLMVLNSEIASKMNRNIGEEAYFANGTSLGTYKGQINHF